MQIERKQQKMGQSRDFTWMFYPCWWKSTPAALPVLGLLLWLVSCMICDSFLGVNNLNSASCLENVGNVPSEWVQFFNGEIPAKRNGQDLQLVCHKILHFWKVQHRSAVTRVKEDTQVGWSMFKIAYEERKGIIFVSRWAQRAGWHCLVKGILPIMNCVCMTWNVCD